jgi:multiple sugar transport system permease protein
LTWDLAPAWVGWENYRNCLRVDDSATLHPTDPWWWHWLGGRPHDPRFYKSLANSLFFSALAVPSGLCASLAVALLLNRRLPGLALARALIYLPHVLGGAAAILIWSWLFNPRFGGFNEMIRGVYALLDPLVSLVQREGTETWPLPDWFYSPAGCKPALLILHVWSLGGSMLIFLAALRRAPREPYDAALVDGAGTWRRFRHVTLPHLAPIILFNALISWTFTMQLFTEPYLLQNRRQEEGLFFYGLYLYQTAFEPPYRRGYACAMAWILFAVTAVVTLILAAVGRRWVHIPPSRNGKT